MCQADLSSVLSLNVLLTCSFLQNTVFAEAEALCLHFPVCMAVSHAPSSSCRSSTKSGPGPHWVTLKDGHKGHLCRRGGSGNPALRDG